MLHFKAGNGRLTKLHNCQINFYGSGFVFDSCCCDSSTNSLWKSDINSGVTRECFAVSQGPAQESGVKRSREEDVQVLNPTQSTVHGSGPKLSW